MSVALQLDENPHRLPPVPWRDPKTVSPASLHEYISSLERACQEHPHSADLRTCLGMAHAVNYDVYKSMETLEQAISLDEDHFFARMKYAELFYRLRALPRAEEETLKALNLAHNSWEFSMARKQLLEIRRLIREGTQKPEWSKPLAGPAFGLLFFLCVLFMVMLWR